MLRACLVLCLGLAAPAAGADAPLKFNRDIRPILAETCFSCHGPDSAARKAKLRLDDRAAAIDRGAIAPGKLDESELVSRLDLADDDEQRMPPPSSHKKLTAEQKATLKRWVSEGAEYEPHWAFIAPTRPAVPAKLSDPKWVRTPVDAFVLAELDKKGLRPAPEADRRTLARRAALDVIGVPPEPAWVEAFVTDTSPNAYEKYLDKLLAMPAWGEHRGRVWLDAARYGDTHGIHIDNYREIWAYRDWVINAFNRNQTFDEFTRDQLAGDLRPKPTLDQLVATGFNRCNITTSEGGAINEEYLVLYARDRTETAATVWMGLTVGCAVCHDHKFDPVSQKEFYGLSAFFNNTTQAAMDGNVKDTPPVVFVPAEGDRKAWGEFKPKLDAANAKRDELKAKAKPRFEAWLKGAKPEAFDALLPKDQPILDAALDALPPDAIKGATLKPGPGGDLTKALAVVPAEGTLQLPREGDFEADEPFTASVWVQIPTRAQSAPILARMDGAANHRGWDIWYEPGRIGVHLIHHWPDDAIKVVADIRANVNEWHHVAVSYDGSRRASGVSITVDGEAQLAKVEANHDAVKGSIRTDAPLQLAARKNAQSLRAAHFAGLRLDDRALGAAEVSNLALVTKVRPLLAKPAGKRADAETQTLFNGYLQTAEPEYQAALGAVRSLKVAEAGFRSRGTVAHVMNEKPQAPEAFVLFRGDYDKRRDKVAPHTPKVLPPLPAGAKADRLALAEWLLEPGHPLTARVTVNRFWQELFGQGLVRSSGDFGVTGETPSHPELLDWLAVEFRAGDTPVDGLSTPSPWDIKRTFKLLMLSSAYRQSAATTPEKLRLDGDNKLVSRGPRFRLDAEVIRDSALSAAGLLVSKIGGPSVRPYQPEGVWEAVAMKESDTSRYRPDSGESLYRRSMYTFWKRAAPPASMEIMNAPNRETCTVKRERTNTPLQALVTLNDPQFVEAARVLAERVLTGPGDEAARLNEIALRVLSRPFKPAELRIVARSLDALRRQYADAPADVKALLAVGARPANAGIKPAELAAWTMLVNELLNLDEALCK